MATVKRVKNVVNMAGAIAAGVTRYVPMYTTYIPTAGGADTEAYAQVKQKYAGTTKNLRVRVSSNSLSGSCTVTVRKAGVDTAVTISIASGTGNFEDTTHEATFAVDDLSSIKITAAAGTGTITFSLMEFDYLTVTNFTRVGAFSSAGASTSTASITRYMPFVGYLVTTITTEDGNLYQDPPEAVTCRNMQAYISANARSTTTTYRVRDTSADGNVLVSVGSSVTGLLEDTANTDTISALDTLNWKMVTGTGSGAIVVRSLSADLVSATDSIPLLGWIEANLNSNSTHYMPIAGGLSSVNNGEAVAQIKMRGSGTLRGMGCRVPTNTASNTVTVVLRKNGADGNQTFTITSGSTGVFQDTTNTDTFADGDLICIKLSRPAGTGSMAMRGFFIECEMDDEEFTPSGGGVAIPIFMNQYRQRWN